MDSSLGSVAATMPEAILQQFDSFMTRISLSLRMPQCPMPRKPQTFTEVWL